METVKETTDKPKGLSKIQGASKDVKKQSVLKKLDIETAKLLGQLKDRANKKSFGRKVRDGEIIGLALKQLSSEHIKELQERSLSEKDRLGLAHEEYQKQYGKLTMNQFIGKLIKGETISRAN